MFTLRKLSHINIRIWAMYSFNLLNPGPTGYTIEYQYVGYCLKQHVTSACKQQWSMGMGE